MNLFSGTFLQCVQDIFKLKKCCIHVIAHRVDQTFGKLGKSSFSKIYINSVNLKWWILRSIANV